MLVAWVGSAAVLRVLVATIETVAWVAWVARSVWWIGRVAIVIGVACCWWLLSVRCRWVLWVNARHPSHLHGAWTFCEDETFVVDLRELPVPLNFCEGDVPILSEHVGC